MGVYEELQERGLIAQITNEDEVRELINNGKGCILYRLRPDCGQLARWSLYGTLPYEKASNGRQ